MFRNSVFPHSTSPVNSRSVPCTMPEAVLHLPWGPAQPPHCSVLLKATHMGSVAITWTLFIIWLQQLFVFSIELNVFLGTPPALFTAQCDYRESLFTSLGPRWVDTKAPLITSPHIQKPHVLIEINLAVLSQHGASCVLFLLLWLSFHVDPVHHTMLGWDV